MPIERRTRAARGELRERERWIRQSAGADGVRDILLTSVQKKTGIFEVEEFLYQSWVKKI